MPPRRRLLIQGGWAVALGGLLALVVLQARGLWLPADLQPVGHALYRIVYFAVIPTVVALSLVARSRPHHLATWVWPVAAAITPIAAWLAWRLLRRLRRPRPVRGADGSGQVDPGRRAVLRLAVGAVGGGVLATGLYATVIAPRRLRVVRYTVPIADLPPALQGFRIVHLSDTHYGPFVDLPYLESVVRTANGLGADLVALTGDYVHQTPRATGPGIGVLGGLRGRLGAVGVLGNHDHWEGVAESRAALLAAGVTLLDNAHVFVSPAGIGGVPRDDAMCVAGLADLWEDQQRFELALAGVPASMPAIVLAHHPDSAERIRRKVRIDLMLSGHTHGGQVRLPFLGAPLVPSNFGQKYAGGLCQGPRYRVVVSRGVGIGIIPVRLGVPPEIGLVTLVRA